MLIIGRFITGFGVGSLTMTVPVYQVCCSKHICFNDYYADNDQAEISPPRWRGTIVGCQQLMLATGNAVANCKS